MLPSTPSCSPYESGREPVPIHYEQYHERTHYWAWYVTVAGVNLPTKHAIARHAKVAAEEHYVRHRVR